MTQQFMDAIFPKGMLHVIFFGSGVPFGIEFMHFYSHISQLFAVEAFVYFAEATLAQKTQKLVFSDARPSACVSSAFQLPISRVLLLVKQSILFDMQCLFLLQSFQYLLAVAFLSTEELRLTSKAHFPLFRLLSIFSLSCLPLRPVQCLFFALYGLQFFPDFSELNAINPMLLSLPVGHVFAQTYLVIADSQPQFIAANAMESYCRFHNLISKFAKQLLFFFQPFTQNSHFLLERLVGVAFAVVG